MSRSDHECLLITFCRLLKTKLDFSPYLYISPYQLVVVYIYISKAIKLLLFIIH